ncbi:MAG: CHAT domain-containing protein [Leptolyngbya sp. SIO3F4]|nr:CHAT domain-containing protein [Leptolyngbya sp. SIO3F4]
MKPIKILILTANPQIQGYTPLRLDAEVRQIEEAIQRSTYRDFFQVVTRLAIRTKDLRQALLDYRPQIVHFSGHGTETQGLVLEDDVGMMKLVSTDALKGLFGALKDSPIECVLFNACYSKAQAIAIYQFVDCVIGMNQPIGDNAAVQFSEAFYDALGAGSSYAEAFDMGCNGIVLEGSHEYSTPVLIGGRQGRTMIPIQQAVAEQKSTPVKELISLSSSPSQSFGNVIISGNNNPFNVIQSEGDVTVNQSHASCMKIGNVDLQVALAALSQLKDEITITNELDDVEKEMVILPIQRLKAELQNTQPDRNVVDRMLSTIEKALGGEILVEPLTKVASLVSKVLVE